jgi:hypothetical protein
MAVTMVRFSFLMPTTMEVAVLGTAAGISFAVTAAMAVAVVGLGFLMTATMEVTVLEAAP